VVSAEGASQLHATLAGAHDDWPGSDRPGDETHQ
jgi:hypothetical protein